MAAVLSAQSTASPAAPDAATSAIDTEVNFEVVRYEEIARQHLGVPSSKYLQGSADSPRFNLHAFWVDHKAQLPLHFGVYLTEVGCIRAASASVETVFSGAGKFMEEAPSAGATLLRMMVRCNVNYQYWFIRPTLAEVIARYNLKHHPKLGSAGTAAGVELAAARGEEPLPNVATTAAATALATATAAPIAAAIAAAGAVAKAAAEAAIGAGATPTEAAAAAREAVAQM